MTRLSQDGWLGKNFDDAWNGGSLSQFFLGWCLTRAVDPFPESFGA